MELKIKISEEAYDAILKDDGVRLDKVHEVFDAIRNGTPATVVKGDELEFVLNKKEAKVFNSLSEEQKEVVCKLLDNAFRQGCEEKDTTNGPVSKEEIDDHVEVCRLMTDYLGRKFTPHEGKFISLYKTIEQSKEVFAGLKGEDKINVKLLIKSLVS